MNSKLSTLNTHLPHSHTQVLLTDERKCSSQTNVSLAHKRVASFAIVQDLRTMFAKVQGFHFFLDFFGGHFFLT